jgi:hypothetical protein
MSTWDGQNYYYSGQGVMLVGPRNTDGSPGALLPVGNVSALSIQIATTVVEHKNSQDGQRAIDLRLITETKATLSMTLERFDAANLATCLRGTSTKQTGGTVTAEPHVAHPGAVVALNKMKVSAVTVHKGASTWRCWERTTCSTPKRAPSMFLATSALILDGDAITVDYTYATQYLTDAMTLGLTDLYLRFEGLNTADTNAPVVVEVFKFNTDPLKELALISDAVQQFSPHRRRAGWMALRASGSASISTSASSAERLPVTMG